MINCLYLLKSLAPFYDVVERFGVYDVYHIASNSHVARCNTQREVRNAVRAHSVGDTTKTTEGRE